MATNTRGIFSLGDVGERQSTQSWATASDVWYVNKPVTVANNPFGYLGGGRDGPGSPVSTIDRIDYSNDSVIASVVGSLTSGKRGAGAAGNTNYGYFAGGNNPSGTHSSIDRLDYSSDSTDTLSKGNLSFSSYGLDGVGNASY